jgi:hypothetical protein
MREETLQRDRESFLFVTKEVEEREEIEKEDFAIAERTFLEY